MLSDQPFQSYVELLFFLIYVVLESFYYSYAYTSIPYKYMIVIVAHRPIIVANLLFGVLGSQCCTRPRCWTVMY